jgi:hypothetical protein
MNYELIDTYHHITNEIKNEIIDLWINNNVLSEVEALDRINYAVCAIKHIPSNKIIGVSTTKINFLPNTNDIYYFYGMFVDKDHRGGTFWMIKTYILEKTFNILKQQNNKYTKGIAIVVENERISDKLLRRCGWTKLINNPLKFRLFFKNFNENS